MFKRIFLFLLTNILIIATLSVLSSLLGIHTYLSQHGINYYALLAFSLVWGMGGALISLLLSRKMAKWVMGVKVIEENTFHSELRPLLDMTHRLARKAGLSKMPQVGVFPSKQLNAFATGPSERSALVAVSSGLLEHMSEPEMEAIIGHELSHIKNGDMVTMTLLQGVINACVIFLARVAAFFISTLSKDRRNSGISFYGLVFLFEMVFMIFGTLVICAFSRKREFRADAGGASLSSREQMISALRRLHDLKSAPSPSLEEKQASFQALMISGKSPFLRLFATHPPLEERIKRLRHPTL